MEIEVGFLPKIAHKIDQGCYVDGVWHERSSHKATKQGEESP